jgi:cytochrome b pre-mRNA-processing protein 3
MKFQWFRPSPEAGIVARLYGTIVAQARSAAFYRDYRVPDTVNGRLELVLLHTVLIVRRLAGEGRHRRLGQALFDHFCSETDAALREMGVGDLAVPRQMRKLGEAFYGRQASLDEALASPDAAMLRDLLQRALAEADVASMDVGRLAAYVGQAARELGRWPDDRLAAGEVAFPDPAAIGGHESLTQIA